MQIHSSSQHMNNNLMFHNRSLNCLNLGINIPLLINIPTLKSFLIFFVLTLHQKWLSYFVSIFLHLAMMAIWIINKGEFKENITIKSGWNARSIFNPKCIIIQFSQLQGGMGGKRHCLDGIPRH